MLKEFPIVILQDRYEGTYSKGSWIAVAVADELENGAYRIVRMLEGGPYGSDIEARAFWSSPPSWVAAGKTPEEALVNLRKALDEEAK